METVHKDFIRLRGISDDAKKTGLTVHLLPEGASAPGGLIALSVNAGIAWQYDFPAAVKNGIHTLYINSTVVKVNGVNVDIEVYRTGYSKKWS